MDRKEPRISGAIGKASSRFNPTQWDQGLHYHVEGAVDWCSVVLATVKIFNAALEIISCLDVFLRGRAWCAGSKCASVFSATLLAVKLREEAVVMKLWDPCSRCVVAFF